MKGQFKGIIIGLIIGLAIATGIAAVASETVSELATLYNVQTEGVRLVVDGKEFTCMDANGAVVKPFIYNGTTYLPVRAVSTAFGKAVYWDGEETTVYLGKMDGKLQNPTAKFDDIENISSDKGGFEVKKNIFDNYGGFYNTAINNDDFWTNDTMTIYEGLLNKKYSTFKATLFVPKGSTWETTQGITIIGDGKVIFPTEADGKIEITKTSKPIEIEVDVTDVNDITMVFVWRMRASTNNV